MHASVTGWFYHAPTKKETDYQPVGAPPPSQIPGLGQMEEFEQEKPKELVFRETDTKYIRLAKMGGRKGKSQVKKTQPKLFLSKARSSMKFITVFAHVCICASMHISITIFRKWSFEGLCIMLPAWIFVKDHIRDSKRIFLMVYMV